MTRHNVFDELIVLVDIIYSDHLKHTRVEITYSKRSITLVLNTPNGVCGSNKFHPPIDICIINTHLTLNLFKLVSEFASYIYGSEESQTKAVRVFCR